MFSLLRSLGAAKTLLAIFDLIVLSSVAAVILFLRSRIVDYSVEMGEVVLFALSSLAAIPIFRELHLYKHRIFTTGADQIVAICKGMLYVGILEIVAIFLIKDNSLIDYSRTHIVLYITSGCGALMIYRTWLFRKFYFRIKSANAVRRRVLAVGAGRAGQALATRVFDRPELGLHLVGFVDDDVEKIGRQLLGKPIFGPVANMTEVADRLAAQEIFVSINSIEYTRLLQIIDECRRTGRPVTVATEHFRIIHDKIGTSEFDYIESLTLRPRDLERTSWRVKRLVDAGGALLLLTLLFPLLGVIALVVRLTSEGPVFYKSQVVGRRGKLFTWFKFRTMRVDRDEAIHREHLRRIIQENGSTEKIKDDPRVTQVGRILRKYSLDELPQLFNVLRGEMSLIGPRPCLQYEYAQFDEWHKQRFHVTPGMTGLWQVVGRNQSDVTFNDSIILDLYYIHNFSLWLDFKILLKTIPTVFFGRGGA